MFLALAILGSLLRTGVRRPIPRSRCSRALFLAADEECFSKLGAALYRCLGVEADPEVLKKEDTAKANKKHEAKRKARALSASALAPGDVFKLCPGEADERLGFQPSNMPPGQIYVAAIQPDSWSDRQGLQEDDELLSVGGFSVLNMSAAELKEKMGERPLELTFRRSLASSSEPMPASSFAKPAKKHAAEKKATPAEDSHRRWWEVAEALRGGLIALGSESRAFSEAEEADAPLPKEVAYAEARQLCKNLLERLESDAPSLYAVARFSAKRNEGLKTRRGVERCLTELALLLSSWTALEKTEAEEMLGSVRALTRFGSDRVGTFLLLCRGFNTPGVGAVKDGGRRWRSGSGTVQQLLSGWQAPEPPLDDLLRKRPELQEHSKYLRATLPFLHIPLQLWLRNLPPEDRPAEAMSGEGASALALRLLSVGADGMELLGALKVWAVDSMLHGIGADLGPGPENAGILVLTGDSAAAYQVLASHASLVKGSKRPQQQWLKAVERVGHAVWLMNVVSREKEDAGAALGTQEADMERKDGLEEGDEETEAARFLVQGLRALLLALTVLERSHELKTRYQAVMKQVDATPSGLIDLLNEALANNLVDVPSAQLAGALSSLVGWRRPELLLKYLDIHAEDERLGGLTTRWLAAVLRVSGESVAQLRALEPRNRRHLDMLAASSAQARRAVRLWRLADARGAADDDQSGLARRPAARWPLEGVCNAEALFMSGEDLASCMRIDAQSKRENQALLGILTQGNARLVQVCDNKGRVDARATLRLLGRADTHEPVVLVDQPLFSGRCTKQMQKDFQKQLIEQASSIADVLRVPLLLWRDCIGPNLDPAVREAGREAWAREKVRQRVREESLSAGKIPIVEFDGCAPFVYSNMNGLVERQEEGDGEVAYALM